MILAVLLLSVLCLFLACGYFLQARTFYRREETWRERERQLVDRLLRKANVEPLEVQRSRVLQIDDDPTPNKSPIDEAFLADEVKEDLEQLHPDVAWMSIEQARARFPQEWRQIEAKLEKRRQPFRVE